MRISIIDRQENLTEEFRELAKRRLLFALSRFASKIDRVSLVVDDANCRLSGMGTACSVRVKLRRLPEVRISSNDADIEARIAHAADRAGRAVRRAIERSQQFDRLRLYPG